MIRDLTIRILSAALLLLCVTAPGWLIQGTTAVVDNAQFQIAYGVRPPPGYSAAVGTAFDLVLTEINGSAIYPTTGSPTICSVSTNGAGIANVTDCSAMYAITQQVGGNCIKAADGGSCVPHKVDSTHMTLTNFVGSFEVGDMLCFTFGCDTNKAQSWVTADLGSCGAGCESFEVTSISGDNVTVYATAPIMTAYRLYDLLGATNCDSGTPCDMKPTTATGNRGWQLLYTGFGPGGTDPCFYSSHFGGEMISDNNFTVATGVTNSVVGNVSSTGSAGLEFLKVGSNSISVDAGGTTYKINGGATSAGALDTLNAAIGGVTTTSADARLNVDGFVGGTGATVSASASKPGLSVAGNPVAWACEVAFSTGGAASRAQRKVWCQAQTTRWNITPLFDCDSE